MRFTLNEYTNHLNHFQALCIEHIKTATISLQPFAGKKIVKKDSRFVIAYTKPKLSHQSYMFHDWQAIHIMVKASYAYNDQSGCEYMNRQFEIATTDMDGKLLKFTDNTSVIKNLETHYIAEEERKKLEEIAKVFDHLNDLKKASIPFIENHYLDIPRLYSR